MSKAIQKISENSSNMSGDGFPYLTLHFREGNLDCSDRDVAGVVVSDKDYFKNEDHGDGEDDHDDDDDDQVEFEKFLPRGLLYLFLDNV